MAMIHPDTQAAILGHQMRRITILRRPKFWTAGRVCMAMVALIVLVQAGRFLWQ